MKRHAIVGNLHGKFFSLGLISQQSAQTATRKTHDRRITDLAAGAHRLHEKVKCPRHIVAVNRCERLGIQVVGFRTVKCLINQRRVIKRTAELYHGGIYEHVTAVNGACERKSFQTAASAQRHISLSAAERAASDINHHIVECEPLALMDGKRPRQFDRKLLERAELTLDHLIFILVKLILYIAPYHRLDIMARPVFKLYDKAVVIGKIYLADCAVDPSLVSVIAHKHYLCAGLKCQFL